MYRVLSNLLIIGQVQPNPPNILPGHRIQLTNDPQTNWAIEDSFLLSVNYQIIGGLRRIWKL